MCSTELAARALVAGLLPMRLPFDHAFDREWFFGLRAATVLPSPCSQIESDFPLVGPTRDLSETFGTPAVSYHLSLPGV